MEERNILVGSGRTFVKTPDLRVKIGSGGYAALGHTRGLLAEGTYEVGTDGTVSFEWEHVMAVDTSGDEPVWKDTASDANQEGLVSSLSLADDSVQPTDMYERIIALWGEDKGDPTPSLEEAGFLMRKISLSPNSRDKPHRPGGGGGAGGGGGGRGRGRYRNRGRRNQNRGERNNESGEGGGGETAGPSGE